MKKIRISSIEILGYMGIFIWVVDTLLRGHHVSDNIYYQFFLGILPNLGAAWVATMFVKWFFVFQLKQNYNIKKHIIICISILVLAVGSEIVHDLFLNSSFDIYDIIITIIAQIVMLIIPLLIKDRCFSNYAI